MPVVDSSFLPDASGETFHENLTKIVGGISDHAPSAKATTVAFFAFTGQLTKHVGVQISLCIVKLFS